MRDAIGRRLQLKSKLLVGAAGMAAAAMSTAAMAADATATTPAASPTPVPATAPIDPPKWLPYVDIGGGMGSGFAVGRADAFVPVWQDIDSLMFVRLGVDTRTKYAANFNLGAGYRTKINSEWILGAFAGFDSSETDSNHTFNQYSLGAEAMSEDWDVRLNGYFADKKNRPTGDFEFFTKGTAIGILQNQEGALSGFDGEVGYRIYNDDSTDFRVFLGGYSFQHDAVNTNSTGHKFNFDYRDIAGPRARAEVDIFDLDMIGPQSRLTIDGEVSHDDVHHTSEYIGATLRIPLGDPSGPGAQALDELDRRMADPVRRQDNVLTQSQFSKPEPVIIYNGHITSQPTNTLYYVEQRSGTGAGTYADKTTLKDATARGPVNQFVVLTDSGGSTIDSTGVVVQSGETVTGAGTFKVRGANSGTVFTHDFAPGSGPVSLTSTGPHVITVDGNANIYGVTLHGGPGGAAIYGHNVSDVTIADVKIIGGKAGIGFVQDGTNDANVKISNTTITGVTGDGIYADVYNTAGGTSSLDLNIYHSTIHAGGHGVYLDSDTSGNSTTTVNLGVHDSAITSGGIGVDAMGTVGAGSTLTQNVVVDPTVINTSANFGIFIEAHATGGTFTQSVDIADVTINGATNAGIYVYDEANHGTVNQTVNFQHVTVHGSTHTESGSYVYNGHTYTYSYTDGTTGIRFFTQAQNGGTVNQTIGMSNIAVDGGIRGFVIDAKTPRNGIINQTVSVNGAKVAGSYYDNIDIGTYAAYGSTIHQNVTLSHITADHSQDGSGVYVGAYAFEGSTTIQQVSISYLTAAGNHFDGIDIGTAAGNTSASTSSVTGQYVTVSHADLSGNGGSAAVAGAEATGDSAARQDVSITGSNLSGGGRFGIYAIGLASESASVQQSIFLSGDHLDNNGEAGAKFDSAAIDDSFVQQNVAVYSSSFDHNGGDGIDFIATALYHGEIEQNVSLYYVTADHNANDGLKFRTDSGGYKVGPAYVYYPHVEQNVLVGYGDISHNGSNGIEILTDAYLGGGMHQYFEIFDESVSHNAANGISIFNQAIYGAKTYQYVGIYTSHIDHNTQNGIIEYSNADATGPGGSYFRPNLYPNLQIFGSTVDYNGADGVFVESFAHGPTYLIGKTYIGAGSDVSHNAFNGFNDTAEAFGYYSVNVQSIQLIGATFDQNVQNGALIFGYEKYGLYGFGEATQNVTIANSAFSQNGANGLYAHAVATDVQGRTEQHFVIQNSTFDNNGRAGAKFIAYAHDGSYIAPTYNSATQSYNGGACTYVVGLYGGCAFVRQTIQISGSDFSNNDGDGITVYNTAHNYAAIYNSSGRPNYTTTLFVAYSTANGNAGDGLHLSDRADTNSYIYSYNVLLASNFNGNGGRGIETDAYAGAGSTVIQETILYGVTGALTTANKNGDDGLTVFAQAIGGTVLQGVGVYYSQIEHNHHDGMLVTAQSITAVTESVIGQYVAAAFSNISHNVAGGIDLRANATGANAATSQDLAVLGSVVNSNFNGIESSVTGYGGGSASQSLYFAADTIGHNVGDGVYAISIATSQGFTEQAVAFGSYSHPSVNSISYNGGDGIYVGAAAFSAGNAEQNLLVYNVSAVKNGGNGLSINAASYGYGFGSNYIYYSHVQQNVIAAYNTFGRNHGNGVSVNEVLYYGGTLNQLLEFIDNSMNRNTGAGFYEKSSLTSIRGNSFSFSTNSTTSTYLIGDTIDHNTGNGIDLRSAATGAVYTPSSFGGYNYIDQHWTISDTTASNNGGSGLSMNTTTTGRYSLNGQYATISGSVFDHNGVDGAKFVSNDYYGPAGFGDSLQQVSISGSDFSGNTGVGLNLSANASGRQGRAEQHFTVTGSTFDGNGGAGVHIYASAINGTYIAGHPCDAVQGLAGGCAFVRQSVVISDSEINHNGGDGVFVGTYANHYSAIYGASGRPQDPTLELYGDVVASNGSRGLNVSNHVSGNSYLYQYTAAIDSIFDRNHSDGVYLASYVGGASTMLQRTLLYSYHTGASASYNAGNGFKSSIEALGGSYAIDINIVEGVDLRHNGSFGFDAAVSYADGTSVGYQINAVYYNHIGHNGDGIGLYSIGSGAVQISYLGENIVGHNSFVGVYGEADFGAFQYIGVYTFDNTVANNGTDYLFNSFHGSTQVLN